MPAALARRSILPRQAKTRAALKKKKNKSLQRREFFVSGHWVEDDVPCQIVAVLTFMGPAGQRPTSKELITMIRQLRPMHRPGVQRSIWHRLVALELPEPAMAAMKTAMVAANRVGRADEHATTVVTLTDFHANA